MSVEEIGDLPWKLDSIRRRRPAVPEDITHLPEPWFIHLIDEAVDARTKEELSADKALLQTRQEKPPTATE